MRFISLLILLFVSVFSLGQDLIVEYGKPLLIREGTTWSGDILIEDTVEVAPGATLTILPGTTVTFDDTYSLDASLRILGSLVAVRTKTEKPIILKNGNLGGAYINSDSNGFQDDVAKTQPHPHPKITLDGIEFYGDQFTTYAELSGVVRVQNSFFYGARIFASTAVSLESNTFLNSSLVIYSPPPRLGVLYELYKGHYYDILNNEFSWDKYYYSNISPIQINDADSIRFESNNFDGVYREEEPFQHYIYYANNALNINSNYINFENYPNSNDFFFDDKDSVNGGIIIRDDLLTDPNPDAGWGQSPSLDIDELRGGDGILPPIIDPDPITGEQYEVINKVNIVVAPGVIGSSPVYVTGLTERINYSDSAVVSHTLEYAGVVYDFNDVAQYLTVVEKNDSFTDNFRSEMLNVVSILLPNELKALLGSSYAEAILFVAGYDGDFAN